MKRKVQEKSRIKKLIIAFSVILLALFVYALTVNFYIIGSAQKQIKMRDEVPFLQNVDCVLVLGCGVKPDGTPSDMLRERVFEGCETYKISNAEYLLLTGDGSSRDGYDEPAAMKKLSCETHGIDGKEIVTDTNGLSTFDSLNNAKQSGVKRVIIITQSYHLPRALYIARKLGFEAYGVEAHLLRYQKQILWSAREVLARNKDFIKCIGVTKLNDMRFAYD